LKELFPYASSGDDIFHYTIYSLYYLEFVPPKIGGLLLSFPIKDQQIDDVLFQHLLLHQISQKV
jgi:hypothetical protein